MRPCWILYIVGLALTLVCSWAEKDIEVFRLGQILEAQESIVHEPMGVANFGRTIQFILSKYFRNSLGGEESWNKLQSLIIRGQLKVPNSGTFEFTNYRKKPDLNKTVLKLPKNNSITTSFDGKEAWQHLTFQTEEPVTMPLTSALDFVRDSVFGSHLIYPELPGKKITYLGEKTIVDRDCYQLKITLPNKQYIIISTEKETGLQVHQEQVSSADGALQKLIQSDYRIVEGIYIPYKIKVYSDDKLINEITLTSVEANKGLMPWNFQRR